MLEPRLRDALAEVARRLAVDDVRYYVGGSLMLSLSGYDVAVGDIDLVVSADARPQVIAALAGLQLDEPESKDPWRTKWLLRTALETASGIVSLDVMGDLALVIDGEVVRFPVAPRRHVTVGEHRVPLGDLAAWYHLYRVHNPARAAVVAAKLSDGEIMAAAHRLSLDQAFSPTLIVRI